MLRVGINGIGRIGRAVLRQNLSNEKFKIVVVNDINSDIENIAYIINYDSIYGVLEDKFKVVGKLINNKTTSFYYYSENNIDEVPWSDHEVDLVIDSSGIKSNADCARITLNKHSLKNIVITHSPDNVDFTCIYGVNETELNPITHKIISSSICDANAIGPVLNLISKKYGIENGFITTLHPWLNYQNLMDGNASSWAIPGTTYEHYALGRSSVGNMIPKPTTVISALRKSLIDIDFDKIASFSYRTPHSIVASAELFLTLKQNVDKKAIIDFFDIFNASKNKIITNNYEPLVSIDFLKSEYSVIIDQRWTEIVDSNLLRLILWYDNEWGYASKVIKLIDYIGKYEVKK